MPKPLKPLTLPECAICGDPITPGSGTTLPDLAPYKVGGCPTSRPVHKTCAISQFKEPVHDLRSQRQAV